MQYYKIDNYSFSKNGDITLQPIDGKLRLELNTGLNEIEFELGYDKEKRWTRIEEWGVIKTDVFYSKNKQLYRIYNIDKGMFSLKIKARHIFFDLVKHNLLDTRAVNCNGQETLDMILEDTKYKGHSDINRINTCYFCVTNIVQAINGDNDNTFRNRWGGEMLFDNFDIYINNRIGGDYGVRVNYSRNMEDVNLVIDRDNIITRAYPRAFDGIMLPEKYIDSPLINKYPIVCEDYIDMSDLKLKDSNTSDDEGFDTEEELFNAMRDRMKKLYEGGLDKPSISGNVKVAMLENSIEYKEFKGLVNIGIGDTVTVKHKDIDIDMKTRAITIEWNLVTKKYENIEFGDVEANYFAKQDIAREQLDNILNKNGNVNADKMEGIINAVQAKFKALRDVAQPQHVLGMLFEDKIKGSKSYGAMAIGSMGFMIASERTLDDKDWNWRTFGSGQGFFADWLVGKLRTVLIENMDGSFQIDLNKPNGASFFNKRKLAMEMRNNSLKFYNWSKDGDYIGSITSLCRNNESDKPLIGLVNDIDSAISIAYKDKNKDDFYSYVTFDKYNVMKDKQTAAIKVNEDIEMNTHNLYNPTLKADNIIPFYVGGKLVGYFNEKRLTLNVPIYNSSGNLVFDPDAPQGQTVDGSEELRERVVNSARKLIGKWYVFGGNYPPLGKDSGTDCSGLMQWAYNDNGIKISRTTYTQIKEGTEVSENELKLGDLVFPSTEHVFMYSGEKNGKHMCVEAAHTGTQLRERSFTWGSGYRARRIIKNSSSGGHSTPGGIAGSKASANIIYYVKGIEGFAPNYYYDEVGVKTLGYGMTGKELNGVSVPLSETSATHYLTNNFNRDYYEPVLRIVKSRGVSNPKQREIDAFASFAYNLGVGAFSESTMLKKYANGERGESIHNEFKRFCHAGGSVSAGLVRRREEEWKIFSGNGEVAGYNGRPYIDIIGGSGSVTANGGYGANPY